MKAPRSVAARFGLIAAGYVCALLVAWGVTYIYISSTNTPDRISSSGMYAFGDSVVFLGAFTLAAIPSTAALLNYLKSIPAFWTFVSAASLVIASVSILAVVSYAVRSPATSTSLLPALAPLWILLSPVFGIVFFLAQMFAPSRPARRLLIISTAIESGVFALAAIVIWSSRT